MNIFDKRPLSLILCIMLGGFVVFSFLYQEYSIIFHIFCLLFLISVLLCFAFKKLRKYKLFTLIAFIALIISFVASYQYFNCYFKAYERFHGDVNIEGEIIELSQGSDYSAQAVIKTDNISGTVFSKYKIQIWLDTEVSDRLSIGDKVSFNCILSDFSDETRDYYFSDGISAEAGEISDFKITEKTEGTLSTKIQKIREILRRKAMLMSDAESGTLLGALLTGERSQLSSELRLNFRRIGISHVLALSGMHLAILTLAIERLLKLARVPKRIRKLSSIVFCLLYMYFVGFSVSVVRAGIMLLLNAFLFLIFESRDSITSLSVAVFLIILFTPYAVYDVALWLSAFATLGVIIAADKEDGPNEVKANIKVLRILTDSLYASVLAIGATMAISVFTFEGLSLISPFSTLIFSFLIEIYMYIGSVMLILGLIWFPLSHPFGKILSLLYTWIDDLSGAMSSFKYSYMVVNYDCLLGGIVVFTVLFFALLIVKLNRKFVAAIILTSFVTLFATAMVYKVSEYSGDELIYSETVKSDLFLIKSGDKAAFVDSSQYSRSNAYDAIDILTENRVGVLDKYIVTHYSFALEENIDTLLSGVIIKEISLPHPKNDDEILIYKKLLRFISDFKCKITLHNEGGIINIGNFKYYPLYSQAYNEGSSVNAAMITYMDRKSYLYLSSGMLDEKLENSYSLQIDTADVIIFGAHGRRYKEHIYIDERFGNADKIFLSCDNLFFTQKSYIEYKESGCKITLHPQSVKLLYEKIKH